jgi:hypothetical protein
VWSILDGPQRERVPRGGDGVAFVWRIDRDDGERRSVRVEIARMALASHALASPIQLAVGSKGATAVLGIVH